MIAYEHMLKTTLKSSDRVVKVQSKEGAIDSVFVHKM